MSRLENMCATGTGALRGATYAVASGAVDIALTIGAEKLKDTGVGGLPPPFKGTFNDLWMPMGSAPAGFAQLAAGYRARYGVAKDDRKKAIAHTSWKSHQNGVHSPKAHSQKAVSMEDLGLADDGKAWSDTLDGKFDRDGKVPCQIDGGLKCLGHPIAASGLRMAYEVYSQLLGRAGGRQLGSPSTGLTHNLGGGPYQRVAAISILGVMN